MSIYIDEIGNRKRSDELLATFSDGRWAYYTYSVYELLMTDKDVIEVTDVKTGVLIKAL